MKFQSRTTTVFSLFLSLTFTRSLLADVPIGKFVDVKPASEFVSAGLDGTLELSPDNLSGYFASNRSGSIDIFKASRTATNQPFGNITRLGSEFNTSGTDFPGAISNDGLALYFTSDALPGAGDHDIFVATRSAVDQPFGNVRNLGSGVNTSHRDTPEAVTADGKTLYFTSDRPGGGFGWSIWKATRINNQDDFANPSLVFADDAMLVAGGSISSDGLYFFYAKSLPPNFSELWVASRDSLEGEFSNPVSLATFSPGSDVISIPGQRGAWSSAISPDWPAPGSKLYFNYALGPVPPSRWTIYEATWVPGLPGDYNQNGVVDAADYTVWRDNLGAPAGTLPNDADGGVIGQAQYDTWKANFGATSGSGSGASANAGVPEPATMALLILVAALLLACPRAAAKRSC